jgi:hypothetical protein
MTLRGLPRLRFAGGDGDMMIFSPGIDVNGRKIAGGIAKVNRLFIASEKHCKTGDILV